MLVKGRGRQRTEVETEHVHSLADELVDGLEIVPDVLLAVFSGDGGLAVPACLGRQIHNDRSLLHHANHLQKRTVSELLPLVEFMNVPHL